MYPELFQIPFTSLTVKSYGLMLVIGFIAAIFLIKWLSRDITSDTRIITNAALYSLIAGIVGARLFYVIHYFDRFKTDLLSVFAIWEGGLELLGGIFPAIIVIVFYLHCRKLPVRKYLDILAIALLLALAFGRIGCFLNGCCFGKPTNLFWGVRFPYGSHPYRSQVQDNLKRNRPEAYLELPDDFFGYVEEDGLWYSQLKPYESLTEQQKKQIDYGLYKCLPVHPTQLYSSAGAALVCLLLYIFWKKGRSSGSRFAGDGCTFALMLILYGIVRFLLEFLRDDNPFEFDGLTVSQNLSVVAAISGAVLMAVFAIIGPGKSAMTAAAEENNFPVEPADKIDDSIRM